MEKEVNEFGDPLWKFAKEFFEKAEEENSIIYYSGYLLKELMFNLDEKQFIDRLELFNYSPNFKRRILTKKEYGLAKEIKKETYAISFYDIIHLLLSKQNNSILITRDKLLMKLAKKHFVIVKKPEEIL